MVFAFDIGTTACKGALFSLKGEVIKSLSLPLSLKEEENSFFHEASPEEWLKILKEIIREVVEKPEDLEALVISGNGPTLLPVSGKNQPLMPAMTWMDRRSLEEAKLISGLMGSFVDPSFYLPKALWIRNNRPEIYRETRHFLSCPEFVIFSLTGKPYMVFPAKGFEPLIWNKEILQVLKFDLDKFPPFIKPGDFAGNITEEAARGFSLIPGIPVFAGGPDFIVSLLGTGTVFPGRVCDRSGTSEGINLCTDKTVNDKRLLCLGHVIEGCNNISGIISTTGKALEWFKGVSNNGKKDYQELIDEASLIPPGAESLIFLPYLSGERAPLWDPLARAAFIGLTLQHTGAHLTKAVLESVGYAIRDVISTMEEKGLEIKELRITGSPSRSSLWNQIKADITGKEILVPKLKDSELAGDLVLALYGLKIYDSLQKASDEIVKIETVYSPREENGERYNLIFELYKKTYNNLKDIFHSLSKENRRITE